jgi:hypothetical protein
MPILIWIATVACMLEMTGVIPRTRDEQDSSKDPT